MRTLRLSLVGTVLVALLGGMGTVAAQSEGDDERLETLMVCPAFRGVG